MKNFLLLIALMMSVTLFASSYEHIQKDCSNLNISSEEAISLLTNWFAFDEHISFSEVRVVTDNIGMTHRTYQQYIDGIPAKGGIILVHCQSNGMINSINGEVLHYADSCFSQPTLIKPQSVRKRILTDIDNSHITETWISCNIEGKETLRKAYRVELSNEFKTVYYDVTTGEILKEESHIYSLMGTAYTVYSGWQNIEYCMENDTNYLYDENRNILTANACNYNGKDLTTLKKFTNPNNRWAIQYLKSVTISTASTNWWYNSYTDTKGDFYIKIKAMDGTILYTSNYLEDTNPPITFTIPSNITIPVENGIKIEVWDYDGVLEGGIDDDGGSKTVTQKVAGTYTWSNSKTTGSYEISERPNPALDVHWGMEKVYDFYVEKFNQHGFDGNNSPVLNLVNPPASIVNNGFPYNACALGGSGIFMYGYGGSAQGLSYFVSIDIMGHEFTHAVTAANANQNLPVNGEGGALNESFGDILGNAIEKYVKNTCDWLVGAEVTNNGRGFRSIKNPSHSNFHHPQTYLTSPYWQNISGNPTPNNDMDGVHINCGVQNYWFYLLSQGGSGINDNGDSYNIAGIGMDKALQIAYRNLLYYITSESGFLESRKGSIAAAQDFATNNLFGITSADVQTVIDAWDAVGVYDYSLKPGKYLVYADGSDEAWFISANLTTTSTKRFAADTIANTSLNFSINPNPAFVWNVTQNSDGTYRFENNGKYMSWTSGNSGTMSTTPKDLDVTYDSDSYGYVVSFKASASETRTLSHNSANGSHYFAFYGNTNQDYILHFVEAIEAETHTIRVKKPADWSKTISAWVWNDDEEGHWESLTKEGNWYVYDGVGNYNIIFINGTTWNGDNNQTIDIAVSSDMCMQIGSETYGKRSCSTISCDDDPEPPVRTDCKTLPYTESFGTSQGDFIIEDVTLDGLSRVWQFSANYGMKASAYVSNVNHPTESWLISPCMELPEGATINLTFDHVYRYTTTPTKDLTLLISENYEIGAPSTATWTPIAIPTYSSGSNWTFVNSGNINLSAYVGKTISIAFRYKSSSTAAATWEIKNVSVTSSPTANGVDNINNQNNATKCIIDGHMFIIRDGHKFTTTGIMIE
ncbi:MAG: M4 family metallopeptidase [Paludibacteraceae bacterium]